MLYRKIILTLFLSTMLLLIVYLFYRQEVRYWIPTPVPGDYQIVNTGSQILLDGFGEGTKKFIHFYNPKCPCSKFNFSSYKSLIKNYSDKFDCYAIIQNSADGVDSDDLEFLEKLGVKVIIDHGKKIARKCGVYSTPQVVLIDENNKLYYRGNYNKTRYCTNPETNYGKIAMDSMINQSFYFFSVSATTAYGCGLDEHTH